jgi:hypothetical protein
MTMSNMFNLIQSVLPNLTSVFRNVAGRCEADLRPATALAGHMALATFMTWPKFNARSMCHVG